VGLLWLVTGVVPQQFPMRIEIFDIVSGLELCCGRPAGLGYEMINWLRWFLERQKKGSRSNIDREISQ